MRRLTAPIRVAGSIIMTGRLASEQVAGLNHNTWPTSSEYAPINLLDKIYMIVAYYILCRSNGSVHKGSL